MADTDFPRDYPIPPANFTFLVESILMQTQIQLGLLSFGEKDEKPNEPNLPLARHSIDMLSMIQDKTKGNLTIEEQRLIENGLTELRFRFVQISDEAKKRREPETETITAEADDRPLIITPDGGKGTKTE